MFFSILMPVYNTARYIEAAVASVLGQTCSDFELLIMDDGSTDGSIERLAVFDDQRLRILRQENQGKSVALNRLLREAKGDYIVLQDSDDRSSLNRLEKLHDRFFGAPELAGLQSGHALLIGNRAIAPLAEAKDSARCKAEVEAYRMPAHDPTLSCRLDVARELGFDPQLRVFQGVDFVFRLAERFPMEVLGECLYEYRVHPGSNTRSDPSRRNAFVRRGIDKARSRRGLEPMDDATFREFVEVATTRPDQELGNHFVNASYNLSSSGNRKQALRTTLDALQYLGLSNAAFKSAVYALAPLQVSRRLRRKLP